MGKTVAFRGEAIPIRRVEAAGPSGLDVVFCSAGSAQAKGSCPMVRRTGAIVIDKSSAFRLDPSVPLVVPEINARGPGHQGVLAVPNCTTIVTVMPLKPLHDAGACAGWWRRAFESASGAGVNGLDDLRQQTQAWARGEAIVLATSRTSWPSSSSRTSTVPGPMATAEELKLIHETRKILEAPDLPISPTTVRVPVFTCHSVSVNAETEEKISAERARELFARFPGLKVWDEPAEQRYPMPILVEGQVAAGWVGFAGSPTPAA